MNTETIEQFRKKPIMVSAYQITRQLLEDCLFNGKPYPTGLTLAGASSHKERKEIYEWKGVVYTIHGQKTYVVENDWVIAEPDGIHYYPCKPDIFENTYEPASALETKQHEAGCDELESIEAEILSFMNATDNQMLIKGLREALLIVGRHKKSIIPTLTL